MGWWGYYDDENDESCDIWIEFLEHLKKKLGWGNNLDFQSCENKFYETITNNPELYEDVIDFVKSCSSNHESIGICLSLIKLLNNKSVQHQPFYGTQLYFHRHNWRQ